MSQSILRRFIIIAVVLVVVVQAMLPLDKSLRLGKDLAGGVTLTYGVQLRPDEIDKKGIVSRVIEVIKERIDPQGQMDISIVPQGEDRIEITMPLPTSQVKDLKSKFENALDSLADADLTSASLARAMAMPGGQRDQELARLAGKDQDRLAKLKLSAEAYDKADAARKALDALADPAQRDEAVARAAQAELDRDKAMDDVLRTVVSGTQLRQAFALSDKSISLKDRNTGKDVTIESPRAQALDKLREDHPSAKAEIDRLVEMYNTYASSRKTLDDPQDLIRLLRGAGVLTFRITVSVGKHPEEQRLRDELRDKGAQNVRSDDTRWCRINDITQWYNDFQQFEAMKANPAAFFAQRGDYVVEERLGEYYMLCWDTPQSRFQTSASDGSVRAAQPSRDELGRPAISFEMDPRGSRRLGELTAGHVQEQMAVLLDDQVYTAPTLRSAISSNGQITGQFSTEEIQYIVRVLAAGSLQAKLSPSPIGQSVVGPDFGLDNLQKGLTAGAISFGVCAAFLAFYYFTCGTVAVFALAINVLMIVGVMALNHAAFTLPGIAGVILTFAMAVDANVLVYERMREEIMRGADLKEALRLGYQRAMPAVVDGNLTNLIVCAVLATFGTPEIKGFGVTMTIGVLTTLFSQLYITRFMFDIMVGFLKWRKTSMLPLAVPAVQKAMELKVPWMSFRGLFYTVFGALGVVAVFMIATRGTKMLDTEFLGGTEVVLQLKRDSTGQNVTLSRSQVGDRVQKAALDDKEGVGRALQTADVIVVNPQADGVTSDRFRLRVEGKQTAQHADALTAVIQRAFGDVIDTPQVLQFQSHDAVSTAAPIYPILTPVLADSIKRADARINTNDKIGGAAIVLEGLDPPVRLVDLQQRLEAMRGLSTYNDLATHERSVEILSGTPDGVTSAVVLVSAPDLSYLLDQSTWNKNMRDREWALVREAYTIPRTSLTLRSFDSAVAQTFAEKAIQSIVISVILIIIYVWVRFGSFRFSAAAIIPTLLDCLVATGLIALSEMLCGSYPELGAKIGLMPFKIDLTVVASILTILGYSINDKIVVLDRIRENRGKLPYVSRQIVDDSINQVMSRTLMTGSTTILSTIVLYIMGGEGVRAFAYSLGLGVILGTMSSIAIGAPIAWSRRGDRSQPETPEAQPGAATA